MTAREIVPKCIFIVPYRNRPQQKYFFSKYMTSILSKDENKEEPNLDNYYEIYFSHQCDERAFNRGATKNIGFLAMKKKYPNNYKTITFIFNDIDTVPFSNIFNYETTSGLIKHFYGFNNTLGGIVSILGEDFEKINGFPNFWGWGMEDNVLQDRCEKRGLMIDRSNFFPLGSPEILHLFDGINRIINNKDPLRAKHDNGVDGISTIKRLVYTIDIISNNTTDNIYSFADDKIFFINITNFLSLVHFKNDEYHNYDLRDIKNDRFNPASNNKKISNFISNTNNWSNIPQYPNLVQRNSLVQTYINQQKEKEKEKEKNNSFNTLLRQSQYLSAKTIYSQDYAGKIGVKPRATTTANIGMGGLKNF